MTETLSPPYPSAGVFRRLAALVYDTLLLMAISMGYYGLAVLINVLIQGAPETGQKINWGHWSFVIFTGWIALLSYFYCYFWRKSGQTLGMRAWRMKLIGLDANPVNNEQCLIRCVTAPFSLFFLGAGYFWRWLDPKKLTLHDRLSKTQVILLPKDKN